MAEVINPLKGKTGAQLEAMRLEKSAELNGIFEAHTVSAADGSKTYDLTVDQLKDVQDRHKELTDIGEARDAQNAIERIAADTKSIYTDLSAPRRPAFQTGQVSDDRRPAKSIGQQFVESKQYTQMIANNAKESDGLELNIDLKTLLASSTGWVPEAVRSGTVVPYANRPILVTDIIPTVPTSQNAYVFMQQTTFTNAAVEVGEGLIKPEAALAWTEVSVPVRKIAVYIPVTDEQLEDVPNMQSIIESDLSLMVRLRLDSQILVGAGTGVTIEGIVPQAGQTQAKGADPTPDAIYKAMTKVRTVGMANPDYFIAHPNDWQDVRLLRTLDGIYIWGNPMDLGPERIWGLPVVVTTAITEGTGLVGDFSGYARLVEKKQMSIKVGYVNDQLITNQRTIVAEIRATVVVLRDNAFSTVTGI